MRLGARTTVWALLLSSVPLLGMAFFTFHSARQSLHATVERQLQSAAQSSLAGLADTIRDAANDVVSWSSLLVVQDVLTDDESGDAGRELARLVQQYPQFSELAAVNERGIVIAATRAGDVGLDLSRDPAWQAGQRGHTYRGHVGDTPLAARHGLVLAAPIRADYDRDTVIGTLLGVVDWERLRAHLHDQTLLGEPQDRSRYLVVRDADVTTPLFDAYGDDGADPAAWPETPGISHAEADGQRFIVGTAVDDDGHGQRLLVHTLLAAAVADTGAYALRDRYVVFGLLILLAAVAAGLAFARSLTRPIVALQVAARRLAQRDFDTPLPAAGRDELGSLTRSFAAMRTAMKSHEAERCETEEKIRRLAYFDQLTGLPNRAFLDEHLRASLQNANRRGNHVAVIYFDLDHFKRVNDTLGHGAGDILLSQAAERLRQSLRGSDCITREPERSAPGNDAVVRFGGDEFIIVLGDVQDAYGVARVARRLLDAFAPSFKLGSDELFVTCSIGIAMYPDDGHDAESLLRNADAAMYDAKQHGRNGYSFYLKEMNARARERLTLEGRLRRAIEREQFELHYQPQIDLRHNRIIGLEALVRWADPEKGLVSPAEFIPLAEETGLILPLGEWILKRACAQLQAWRGTALDGARVAVNLSLRQVKEKNFARVVEETLAAHGLGPDRIELELTESVLMEDSDGSSEILAKLKSLGLRLSIDDFGTGYSSLSYLKRFAIDSLKIDRSFVRDIESDPNDQAIITAVIAMAHKLNLEVIAEGVETVDQARLLRQLGCDQIQGFWISRPLPAVDIERFARSPIAVLDQLPAPATTALLSLRGSARAG